MEIMSRLIFDSISLSSHILRRNIGSFKMRRNSQDSNNISTPQHDETISKSKSDIDAFGQSNRSKITNHIAKRQKKSLLQRSNKKSNTQDKNIPISFLPHNSADRDRLYFELKNFETSSKHREIEERLETLITAQLEANRLQLKTTTGRHLPSENTTLRHPTWFGTKYGDGLVLASGVRQFDFLLLDWRPNEKDLVPVLSLVDTAFDYLQVSHFLNI